MRKIYDPNRGPQGKIVPALIVALENEKNLPDIPYLPTIEEVLLSDSGEVLFSFKVRTELQALQYQFVKVRQKLLCTGDEGDKIVLEIQKRTITLIFNLLIAEQIKALPGGGKIPEYKKVCIYMTKGWEFICIAKEKLTSTQKGSTMYEDSCLYGLGSFAAMLVSLLENTTTLKVIPEHRIQAPDILKTSTTLFSFKLWPNIQALRWETYRLCKHRISHRNIYSKEDMETLTNRINVLNTVMELLITEQAFLSPGLKNILGKGPVRKQILDNWEIVYVV